MRSILFSEHFLCFSCRCVPEITNSHLLKSFSTPSSFGWGVSFFSLCLQNWLQRELSSCCLHPESTYHYSRDFPGGPTDPSASAGEHGLDPRSRKIPRGTERLRRSSMAAEPTLAPRSWNSGARLPKLLVCLKPVLHHQRSHCKEKPEHRNARVAAACHS